MFDVLPVWVPEFLGDLLQSGGVVVAILLLMAVTLLAVFLLKWWQLWRQGAHSAGAVLQVSLMVDRHLASGNYRHNTSDSSRKYKPVANIAKHAIEIITSRHISSESAMREVQRHLEAYQRKLQTHLPVMELIATLAPSLGLLGTVLGMIEAFQAMEQAGRNIDPSILSGGIWQALLTTAVGLSVAIPAIIMHSWLSRGIDSHLGALDSELSRLLNLSGSEDVIADTAQAASGGSGVAQQVREQHVTA